MSAGTQDTSTCVGKIGLATYLLAVLAVGIDGKVRLVVIIHMDSEGGCEVETDFESPQRRVLVTNEFS